MHLQSLKKYTLLLLLQSSLFSIENTIYVEIGASNGLNDTIKSSNAEYIYDSQLAGSAIIGYQHQEYRFELQEIYKQDSLNGVKLDNGRSISKSGDVKTSSHMLNYYYNGYNQSKFISSIGVGAGLSSIELDGIEEKSLLSVQGMFSVGYMMTEEFIFTTKYTYLHITSGDTLKANKDRSIALSLRYLF